MGREQGGGDKGSFFYIQEKKKLGKRSPHRLLNSEQHKIGKGGGKRGKKNRGAGGKGEKDNVTVLTP